MRKVSTLRCRGRHVRAATALALSGALVASAGVVMLGAPTATAEPDPRVVVCKYVGTPPGGLHHVIIVSENTLNNTPYVAPPGDGVGDSWTDAQGQTTEGSFVIRYAAEGEQAKDVSLSECPGFTEEIPVPAMPGTSDPCNLPGVTSNIAFVVPADTDQLDWTLLENGDVTVAPKSGYRFEGELQLVPFELPADSGELCEVPDEEIAVPAKPGTTDPCNLPGVTSNIAFVVPADTDQLDWTLLDNGNVTVAPKPGYEFAGDSQLVTFELPADSGDPCDVAGVEEVAPVVTFQDPTCAKLDRFTWKGNLESIVDYSVSGTPGFGATVTVTATIKPAMADQYAFVEGFDSTFTHRYPTLAELDCVKGTQTTAPKPDQQPTVLGTQAAVPSAVAAGIGGPDEGTGLQLLGRLMTTGGLLLLAAAGWVAFGRRTGEHRI